MKKPLRSLLTLTLAFATSAADSAFSAEAKRVIVVTVTTGFRHSSIATAEATLQKLAAESGAFTIVDFARQPEIPVPQKPKKPKDLAPNADDKAKARYEDDLKKYDAELAKWTPAFEKDVQTAQADFDAALQQSLQKLSPANLAANKIDGVIFANTTGDLPLPDKEGFIQWIQDGHAFMGMHSSSDTFHQFDGYKAMLQGEFKTHGKQVPADLQAGDTAHPANGGIGAKWDLKQEEMYEFKDGSHDRTKLRALWFLRHPPQEPDKAEYAGVSWCRKDGKGRVFYTSLGHREDLWSDDPNLPNRVNDVEISKQYQAHILGGIKWALGLVEGSAEPNPEVK
jgi:type 1 glutamine amidotransferase